MPEPSSGLTPEERQRIYLEEKARLEIRNELEPKTRGFGSFVGYGCLGIVALLVIMWIAGTFLMQSEATRVSNLSPAERREESARKCAEFQRAWAFKTYGELTPTERAVKYDCEHPDNK